MVTFTLLGAFFLLTESFETLLETRLYPNLRLGHLSVCSLSVGTLVVPRNNVDTFSVYPPITAYVVHILCYLHFFNIFVTFYNSPSLIVFTCSWHISTLAPLQNGNYEKWIRWKLIKSLL